MIHARFAAVLLFAMALTVGACATQPADEAAGDEVTPPPLAVESPAAGDDASPTGLPEIIETPAAPTATEAAGAATIATGDTDEHGTVLTDADGMTLYVFLDDVDGQSTCYDACADAWPPVLADGEPAADSDLDEGLLGTAPRDDGTQQVTYDSQPLYLYQGDSAPGDLNGFGSGDVWYPVAPDGAPIGAADGGATDDGY